MKNKTKGAPGRSDDIITPTTDLFVDAKAGDDTVIFSPSQGSAGGVYKGGSGIDTLELNLTSEEWLLLAPTLQDEIDSFLAHLTAVTNPSGQANGNQFSFDSLGLKVKQFEHFRLVIDGVEVTSPGDDPVDAQDDSDTTDNRTVLDGNVLDNDSVPDLVASVEVISGPGEGTLTFNPDGTFQFDPGRDFDDLSFGESRDVEFIYEVTDANGDSDTATATITVEGTNTPPEAVDDDFVTAESTIPVSLDVLFNDSDPENDDLTITSIDDSGVIGSLSVDATTNQIVYDDLGYFDFLADGQFVEQSFGYTISDGNGGEDSATVTFTIEGEGSAETESVETDSLENGQEVSVTLSGPGGSEDGSGDFTLNIGLSAVIQPNINVVYVVDTSGSTIASVLAQEIDALEGLTSQIAAAGFADGSVTISIVPFSTVADPDATGDATSTFTLDTQDDVGSTDVDAINLALNDLSGGGFTNYVAALNEATQTLTDLETTNGAGTNVVYFLSDGQPTVRDSTGRIVTQTEAEIGAAAAPLQAMAQISTFEIGNVDAINFLDAIDNTGGTTQVSDPSDLSAALLGSPIPEGSIVDADLFVFDDMGVLQNSVALDPADFNETLLGFEYDINNVTGLADDLGEQSLVRIAIGLDDDNDGVADITIETEVDVFGF